MITLYHGTSADNKDSILENGMRGDSIYGLIWLTDSPEIAHEYAEHFHEGSVVVFEVMVDENLLEADIARLAEDGIAEVGEDVTWKQSMEWISQCVYTGKWIDPKYIGVY
jgi:RNA:NAD 2'-phosphotransferase (TPT1/KptA family)